MSRYFSIGKASERLGVSISTLRRWETQGRLIPERTKAGHRRYEAAQIERVVNSRVAGKTAARTIAYARVSSSDQKEDLTRQQQVLELFCAKNGWTYEVVSDLGSGMNYHKKGLVRLLNELVDGDVERLVITHKDRLLRFGAELVFAICEIKNVEVVIINRDEDRSFEQELAQDVLEIITVFSARLYGARSKKNQKMLQTMKKAAEDAQKE
jgi:predicted site-specific integrase-resolvase